MLRSAMKSPSNSPFLVGNTFPLSLVRRRVTMEPRPVEELRQTLRSRPWRSFWGHSNTLPAANALLDSDLTPETERPAISLTPDKLPSLGGLEVRECWILSPDYAPGFRPALGAEIPPEKILSWQVVRILWD